MLGGVLSEDQYKGECTMRRAKNAVLALMLALGAMPCAMAQYAALPYPNAATPKPIDLGETKSLSGASPMSVTIALALPGIGQAENLLKSVNTPGDPQFHQFLTADQFVARFAPTDADVAKVIASLAKYGLTAQRTGATTLKATGLPADVERAFGVTLHSYEVLGHGNATGYSFHAPSSRATIPAEISASVAAVVGLDSRPSFRPLLTAAPQKAVKPRLPVASTTTANPFGYLTVTDFAGLYDVQPLYGLGVSGRGRTVGIMTLASFTPSDAYAYWSAVGLKVSKHRIAIVNVDGGPGAPSDDSGSDETTLDVEQSGGIAPGANVIVYQAPNTNQGFVDVFAAAIDAPKAQSLSISWGDWEWFNNFENAPVTDPTTGRTVGSTVAVHELLVRAGIQGQTVFAAAGDGGAYDVNDDLGCYGPYSPTVPTSCSRVLSVDYPASDPAITAAGGTTLPGLQQFCLNTACTTPYNVYIPHERVWGWDYLFGFCDAIGYPDPVACGIFAVGGGGGVSVLFAEPPYQYGISGVHLSQPHQVYIAGDYYLENDGFGLFYALPAYYPGRNVPDVSFNADPDTGYVIYYTSSASGFGLETFIGGTSFVGPQLNGVAALLGQYVGARPGLGLLNYTLYGLAAHGRAYGGRGAPLHAIAYGDNWFYDGRNGYSPAAGLGTLDVFNFAQVLRGE
jgi:subtilase family serine protease